MLENIKQFTQLYEWADYAFQRNYIFIQVTKEVNRTLFMTDLKVCRMRKEGKVSAGNKFESLEIAKFYAD